MGGTTFDFESRQTQRNALSFFLKVVDVLDHFKIHYFLEGGTLLGIVRDRNLLPWDHDIDFSINHSELKKILKLRWHFLFKGYKFSIRKSTVKSGPFNEGDITIIKLKPVFPYLLNAVASKAKGFVVCDVFIKKTDGEFYYWQAKDQIMRVAARFHDAYDNIEHLGRKIMVPAHYREYLTKKFGDWSVPVKDWDCGRDEKTIWKPQ
jgi:lipopolysaccharide cholinephosphotransferase